MTHFGQGVLSAEARDGVIVTGTPAVDASMLTGESVPVEVDWGRRDGATVDVGGCHSSGKPSFPASAERHRTQPPTWTVQDTSAGGGASQCAQLAGSGTGDGDSLGRLVLHDSEGRGGPHRQRRPPTNGDGVLRLGMTEINIRLDREPGEARL